MILACLLFFLTQNGFILLEFAYFCAMNEDIPMKVEITDDGSATIFVTTMDEHYHSVRGALTESCHIYRDCAFRHRAESQGNVRRPLRLLEVGFGTGLNATVTAMFANENCPVHYISLEKYPLSIDIVSRLGYDKIVDGALHESIQTAEWNTPVIITPHFTLEKRRSDYTTFELPQDIDIIYFDAFAPEKQPEMWSKEAFARLIAVMNPGAVLTTYCAKGEIRRMLASLGLTVERLAGPPGGKREILRATKPVTI